MSTLRIRSILSARCPACHEGEVMKGVFALNRSCAKCGYDFNPENGFYLGAMAISFLIAAMLTVPPMIALKLMQVEIAVLVAYPLVQLLFVGTFLLFYSRVLWLHLEYRMTHKLDGKVVQRKRTGIE